MHQQHERQLEIEDPSPRRRDEGPSPRRRRFPMCINVVSSVEFRFSVVLLLVIILIILVGWWLADTDFGYPPDGRSLADVLSGNLT